MYIEILSEETMCSFQKTDRFQYTFVNMMMLDSLRTPKVRLVRTHPVLEDLLNNNQC